MQKVKRIALLFSIFLILLISIAAVSAANADDNLSSGVNEEIVETGIGLDDYSLDYPADGSVEDNGDMVLCSDSSSNDEDSKSKSSLRSTGKSSLKDSSDSVYYVDNDNWDSFFADGFLKDDYADSILVFNGEFNDKGILDIKSSNVTIIGNNSLLKNTAFCLESNNIMLAGLDFVWNREFSDNDNAGILVLGDNCTIYKDREFHSCKQHHQLCWKQPAWRLGLLHFHRPGGKCHGLWKQYKLIPSIACRQLCL